MLIENQLIKTKWNPKTKKHYIKLNYTFTKMGDEFEVKLEDLTKSSISRIKIKCDYCGRTYNPQYNNYISVKNKEIINKDACKKCSGLKLIESNQLKYGVNSTSQIPEIKDKQKQTLLKNYNVDNPGKSKIIQKKMQKTCLEKYGVKFALEDELIQDKIKEKNLEKYDVEYPFQSQKIIKKIQSTHLEKYGYKIPSCNKIIKDKIKQTILKKYGVENVFQSPIIKEKIRKTLYKNGTAPQSKQQEYIYNLIGGKLNYPINNFSLDITFPEEKIYIEYNGGGHNNSVKFRKLTQEQFDKIEIVRNNILKRAGWRKIQIDSKKDYIPIDKKIIEIIEIGKEILIKNNRSWIIFDIDNGSMRYKNYESHFDFGILRLIK